MIENRRHTSLIKLTLFLLLVFLTVVGFYFLKPFLVPLCFALIFAMLMMPVSDKLMKWGVPKGVSILTCILIILFVFLFTSWILYGQIENLAKDLPRLKQPVIEKIAYFQDRLNEKLNISSEKQKFYLQEKSESFFEATSARIKSLLIFTTGFIGSFLLVLVYTCLLMIYRKRFRGFFIKIFPGTNGNNEAMIQKISAVAGQFLFGRLITIVLLAIMYSVGLLLAGVKYALFLAILSAILSIIPIFGTLIGVGISLLFAFAIGNNSTILWVFLVFVIVQLIENYILTPVIIGNRVNLNPLFTIIAVMAGSLLWGIPGMILSIPLLAILKILFDNIKPLEPLGHLMGRED